MAETSVKSRWSLIALAVAAGLMMAAPHPALAGPKDAMAAPGTVPDYVAADAQEAEDAQIVQRIMVAMQRGGYPALGSQRKALIQVLDRAPASYPLQEVRGDKTIIRYDPEAGVGGLVLGEPRSGGPNVEYRFNAYGMAAFLLGSYAVDQRDSDAALGFLNRGLAMQPGNPMIAGEKNTALTLDKDWAQGLETVDAALNGPMKLSDADRARLLRARGFDLTELNRLDEAEQAYKLSLKLEPGHRGAMNELTYIAQLRAGAPKADTIITSGAKSADGTYLEDPPK